MKGRRNGRASKGQFLALPLTVIKSSAFTRLNGNAVKLLVSIGAQYNGNNNGDLTAAYTVIKNYGFNSKGTVQRAKQKLLETGFIVKTRHGRFMNPGGVCDLYAITWQPINECPGKDLEMSPTRKPLMSFLSNEKQIARPQNRAGFALKTGSKDNKTKKETGVTALKTGAIAGAHPAS